MKRSKILVDFFNYSSLFLYCPFRFYITSTGRICKSTNKFYASIWKFLHCVGIIFIRFRSVAQTYQMLISTPTEPKPYFLIVFSIINIIAAIQFLYMFSTKSIEIRHLIEVLYLKPCKHSSTKYPVS